MLADMVRTDFHQLRAVAANSELVETIKILARAHKTLVWERTRHILRLRQALREYFPAALVAFDDLAAPDVLELLGKAPTPLSAARLTSSQIQSALRRARRRDVAIKAEFVHASLRSRQLARRPGRRRVRGDRATQVAILKAIQAEIGVLGEQLEALFDKHPDASIYRSQPGLGPILGARVLAEFGDDRARFASAAARKNYAGIQSDHPGIWQKDLRRRAVCPQQPSAGCPGTPGLHRPDGLARRQRLLRRAARPAHDPPRRAPPSRQQDGRNPSRLPTTTAQLRREHRLGPPLTRQRRRLTSHGLGCLSSCSGL